MFGPLDEPEYEIYDGPMGQRIFVRWGGSLVGVVDTREEALRLVTTHIRKRRDALKDYVCMEFDHIRLVS